MNILEEIQKPLSGNDIMRILNFRTKVILYPEIINYSTIEELLSPYGCVVILYMQDKTNNSYFGHWCCLFQIEGTNKLEFFDPMGIFCDDELDMKMNEQFRIQNGLQYPLLTYLLFNNRHKYKLTYNQYKFQKRNENINTCGRHCCVRLLNKDKTLKEYKKYIDSFNIMPDITVTLLTL